ncbi:MAG: sulfatase-like hydrolase/transferase [Paenibacillaceae bacterium]|nr:sulfatase-like hydrolase/transferase [Paenibacillaceae bacterium]
MMTTSAAQAKTNQPTRPNIIVLMTDQQKASAFGAQGNPHVISPFQDEMAAKGVLFANAHACSTICTPSRATMMTGVHPLVHGVTCHQNRVPYNLPQLAELMQRAGYYTAIAGHYETNRNINRGWHEQSDIREAGPLYDAWAHFANHGRRDVGWSSGGIDTPPDKGLSALLTDRAIEMLDNALATGEPIYMQVNYLDPHPPYYVPKPYDTLIDPDTIPLPAQGGDAGRPAWQLRCLEDCGTAQANERNIREVVAAYYGMIAYVNDQMRRFYDAMRERGMLDNTWIIVTSDHGDYTGEKGLFNKTETPYECLTHVPLVIVPPEGWTWRRQFQVDELVELADIFPTILHLAGAGVPAYAQGHDLIDWVEKGTKHPLRDCAFAQVGAYQGKLKSTFPGGIPESGRHPGLLQAARTKRYSYIMDPDYGDEAYDLERDPLELNNLLNRGQPPVPAEVLALKDRIAEWNDTCRALKDELGLVWGDRGFGQAAVPGVRA